VQTQYFMLDEATAKLFGLATDLTEVFVVSVLDREPPVIAREDGRSAVELHQAAPEEGLRRTSAELRRTSPP
jgi:hypothetical protein